MSDRKEQDALAGLVNDKDGMAEMTTQQARKDRPMADTPPRQNNGIHTHLSANAQEESMMRLFQMGESALESVRECEEECTPKAHRTVTKFLEWLGECELFRMQRSFEAIRRARSFWSSLFGDWKRKAVIIAAIIFLVGLGRMLPSLESLIHVLQSIVHR